jgi:D-mannonate dehydratase
MLNADGNLEFKPVITDMSQIVQVYENKSCNTLLTIAIYKLATKNHQKTLQMIADFGSKLEFVHYVDSKIEKNVPFMDDATFPEKNNPGNVAYSQCSIDIANPGENTQILE